MDRRRRILLCVIALLLLVGCISKEDQQIVKSLCGEADTIVIIYTKGPKNTMTMECYVKLQQKEKQHEQGSGGNTF